MEKLKPKHDHKLTDIIKVGMFALMLLLPFIVLLPTGLYYGFNEHAEDHPITTASANISYEYTTNELNNNDDITIGNTYLFELKWISPYMQTLNNNLYNQYISNGYMNTSLTHTYEFWNNGANNTAETFNVIDIEVANYVNITPSSTTEIWRCGKDALTKLQIRNISSLINSLYTAIRIDYGYKNNTGFTAIPNGDYTLNRIMYASIKLAITIQREYSSDTSGSYGYLRNARADGLLKALPNEYNNVENVEVETETNYDNSIATYMYQAWQATWETPLFNWTNNSILNTGLTAFCNGLGISTQSNIANFLTYELVIMAIYVILDIVITLFKWLTHIGQRE